VRLFLRGGRNAGLKLRRADGLISGRERDIEGAALAWGAGQPDRTAMQGNQLPGDGQSQARAAELAGGRAVKLVELVEDAGMILRCDADAGIRDPGDDPLAVLQPAMRG